MLTAGRAISSSYGRDPESGHQQCELFKARGFKLLYNPDPQSRHPELATIVPPILVASVGFRAMRLLHAIVGRSTNRYMRSAAIILTKIPIPRTSQAIIGLTSSPMMTCIALIPLHPIGRWSR